MFAKAIEDFAPTVTLFFLLASADLLFMLIHAVHVWTPWLNAIHYSLEADRGLAENYQYIKMLWIVLCLLVVYQQTRSWSLLGWALLFAFLLVDDTAEIHERAGHWFAARFEFPSLGGLRPNDFGELLFAAIVGKSLVVLTLLSFLRGNRSVRHFSRDLFCLIAVLAFFGVVVDLLHVISYFKLQVISDFLALVEDGGEMLMISLITVYIFDVVVSGGNVRIDVWGKVIRVRN